jgi:D-sedoheptulose 7-phosphate isomerase
MKTKYENLDNYLNDLIISLKNINLKDIDNIVNLIEQANKSDNDIFIMGNGGSAATASHFMVDLNKGVSEFRRKRIKSICLNDNIPSLLAISNDMSFEDIFVEQLKNFCKKNDLVIAISCSGRSKNILKAVEYANSINAISVSFTGFDGGELIKISKYSILVPTHNMEIIEDCHLAICHIIKSKLISS